MQVNATNRTDVIATILASYNAMMGWEQIATAHAMGVDGVSMSAAVEDMTDDRLSVLLHDIEDNGLLVGAV